MRTILAKIRDYSVIAVELLFKNFSLALIQRCLGSSYLFFKQTAADFPPLEIPARKYIPVGGDSVKFARPIGLSLRDSFSKAKRSNIGNKRWPPPIKHVSASVLSCHHGEVCWEGKGE